MSRARVHEVSSPISLFPFIGILLCTMGALLVDPGGGEPVG